MLERPALLNVARSATGRRWTGPDPTVERLGAAIVAETELPEVVAQVLAARGVEPAEAAGYLAPTLRDLMPDPASLADMDAAAGRLARAAASRQRVAIFGDYDVDGAASAALIAEWLAHFGVGATVHIPDRVTEGYGPNAPAMQRLGAAHDLVVCVDCGTAAPEPLAAARAAGADVVVIDHHLPGDALPEVAALVNPNRVDCAAGQEALCAAGVAFLVLVAANRLLREQGIAVPDLRSSLDLVAVATVADVAPLTGLNRAFVRQGLAVMARRGRPGLAALADTAGLRAPPRSSDLGFVLGPRLNAGGRVDEAGLSVRLLMARGPDEAAALAAQVEAANQARRRIEGAVLDHAVAQAEARLAAGGPAALAWAAGEGWHPGVVGIVAGRLRERFDCPAVVIALNGGEGRGSARSVPGVDLGSAIAAIAREGLIARGGGHLMAAGLSLTPGQVAPAMAALADRLAAAGAAPGAAETLAVDAVLAAEAATPELVTVLEAAGPYGQGSPPPRVAMPALVPEGVRVTDRGHCSMRLAAGPGRHRLAAIAFQAAENGLARVIEAKAAARAPLHVAGRLEIDDWGGRRRAKLRLDDVAPA
ncbi:MAG: single-stranded-DNA-specific exonuclease RecJ [Pseudomonadota bacterium]